MTETVMNLTNGLYFGSRADFAQVHALLFTTVARRPTRQDH
jgi:hypothetical protein